MAAKYHALEGWLEEKRSAIFIEVLHLLRLARTKPHYRALLLQLPFP